MRQDRVSLQLIGQKCQVIFGASGKQLLVSGRSESKPGPSGVLKTPKKEHIFEL